MRTSKSAKNKLALLSLLVMSASGCQPAPETQGGGVPTNTQTLPNTATGLATHTNGSASTSATQTSDAAATTSAPTPGPTGSSAPSTTSSQLTSATLSSSASTSSAGTTTQAEQGPDAARCPLSLLKDKTLLGAVRSKIVGPDKEDFRPLKELSVDGRVLNTKIQSIEGLGCARSLKKVWLPRNELVSYDALNTVEQLRSLNVVQNPGGTQALMKLDDAVVGKLETLAWTPEPSASVEVHKKFIQRLRSLKHIALHQPAPTVTQSLLPSMVGLPNLTGLSMAGGRPEDVTSLTTHCDKSGTHRTGKCASLTHLSLTDMGLEDTSWVPFPEALENLYWLELSSNKIETIAKLSLFRDKLKFLYLEGNDLKSIAPLQGFSKIQHLKLSNSRTILDVGTLSTLSTLTTLFLQNMELQALPDMSKLKSLVDLRLHNNKLKSIKQVANATLLLNLFIEHNDIRDLTPVSQLTSLRNLDIANNPNLEQLGPLGDLATLETIDARSCKITDVSPLVKLVPKLKKTLTIKLQHNPKELCAHESMTQLLGLAMSNPGGQRVVVEHSCNLPFDGR